MAQAVEASFAVGHLPAIKGSELSVVFTDDEHVRQLNADYRENLSGDRSKGRTFKLTLAKQFDY